MSIQHNELHLLNCLINSIQQGVLVLDRDLRIYKVNDWILSRINNGNEIFNTHCYKSFHNFNKPCNDCPVLKAFETEEPIKHILHSPFNETADILYEITASPIFNKDGNVEFVVENFNDITHLKKVKEDLVDRNDKYNALYNKTTVAYQSLDAEGVILEVNPSWLNILGYSREEVIGNRIENFLHIDDVTFFKNLYVELIKQGTVDIFELRLLHKQNKEVSVLFEGSVSYNANGTFKQTHCTFQDISKLRHSEKQLKSNKLKLEKIFLVAPTGIGQVVNRVITDVNNKIVEMTGYEAEELIGQSSLVLYPDKEEFEFVGREKYAQIAKYETGTVETKWKKKNGDIIDVLLSSTPIDVNDISKGTIFTALDITTQKRYQENLLEAKEKAEESSRLKTEFLRNLSHEIRTPMNGIIGFSKMLDKPGINDDKRKYFARIVQNSSLQLLRIINDILEISTLETKQETIKEGQLSLNDLLSELFTVFELQSRKKGLVMTLVKALPDEDCIVVSDKAKLNKILSNLIDNAIKFTNHGYIRIGYYLELKQIVFFIEDTGVGIASQYLESIFERFAQEEKDISRKTGGLGLGLSISKENAKLLGGEISVESEKGKGAKFYVRIPFIQVNTEYYQKK